MPWNTGLRSYGRPRLLLLPLLPRAPSVLTHWFSIPHLGSGRILLFATPKPRLCKHKQNVVGEGAAVRGQKRNLSGVCPVSFSCIQSTEVRDVNRHRFLQLTSPELGGPPGWPVLGSPTCCGPWAAGSWVLPGAWFPWGLWDSEQVQLCSGFCWCPIRCLVLPKVPCGL